MDAREFSFDEDEEIAECPECGDSVDECECGYEEPVYCEQCNDYH